MSKMKRFFGVFLFICMVLTMMPFMQNEINGSGNVNAATVGTADSMTSFANKCAGKSKPQLGLSGEWCASFVYYCAKNSGNAGKIGNSAYVGTQAEQTVNSKGGTITFVNKAAYNACKNRFTSGRCKYNPNYVPKAGDLYIQKGEDLGDQYFAHVGIVRKNSTKSTVAYTVEGNTSCSDGKHSDFYYVEYKTRNKNNFSAPYGFSAFVTPKYSKQTTHKFSYALNGGTGSFKNFNVKDGDNITVSSTRPTKYGYTFKGWYVKRLVDKKWYVNGKGWCTWDYISKNKTWPKIYTPGKSYRLDSSWTSGSTKSNYCFYAQWDANTWTVKYKANGGKGKMANTQHTYGVKTYLRKNTFTRSGYRFDNWHVYRPNVNKWLYRNGKRSAWYKKGQQPSGYYLETYNDGGWVSGTTSVNGDVVILYAKWKKR